MTVIPNIPEAELPQMVDAVLPGLLKMFDGDKERLKEAIQESLGPPWPEVYKNRETGKVYKPHHEQEAKLVYTDDVRYQYLRGGEGGGKALAIDTPLPTPTGWTTMGDVQPGDQLLSDWGESCNVTAVSPVYYDHDCYEVIFNDGTRIVADAGHLWLTIDSRTRTSLEKRGEKYSTGTHSHLPHCQPKYEPHTITTEEMARTLLNRRGFHNHAIPITAPLTLPEVKLPVDPYVLGIWLGDGTSRSPQITVGKQDQDEILGFIEAAGHTVVHHVHSEVSFGIDTDEDPPRDSGGHPCSRPGTLRAALEELDLLQNKHIPQMYLRASYDQRLALLQGLMDADGTISPRGKAEYCTISEDLAKGFEELCLSLAIKVRSRLRDATCNGKVFKDYRYRFTFTPYVRVFRLTRKARRVKQIGRHGVRQFRWYVTGVNPVESVPVKCVVVDSPSRMFLAGRRMVPTHNSVAGIIKTLDRVRKGASGIVCSPDLPHF